MRNVICGVLFMLLVTGCGADGESSSEDQPKSAAKLASEAEPQWIKTIREGGTFKSINTTEIKAWLAKNLDSKTTRKDVLALFGKPGSNEAGFPFYLDRPERDDDSVCQYHLPSDNRARWTYLVFHFDPKTDFRLIDFEFNGFICGYCPHVFAFDDRWRLEGKMLAGCVGRTRKGTDLMVLPRLEARDGRLLVKLSNLAPEIDYVTQASLAGVALDDREQLDVSRSGELVVWRSQKEIPLVLPPAVNGASELTVNIDPAAGSEVVVLEVRNTSAFEAEMRQVFLAGRPEDQKTTLTVSFKPGRTVEIQPVGTKFLRRVVIPLPKQADSITLRSPGDFWFTRRLWIGKEVEQKQAVIWRKPADTKAIRLSPMENTVLEFPVGREETLTKRMGYVLRIKGYYDFVKNP